MNDLNELLERVKAVTSPSWRLNVDLECALPDLRYGERNHRPSNRTGMVTCNSPSGRSSTYNPRRFTSSVDDALSLVRRVLPDWTVSDFCQNSRHAGDPWGCELSIYHGSDPSKNRSAFSGWGYSEPALAIIAAVLTALIAQEASK